MDVDGAADGVGAATLVASLAVEDGGVGSSADAETLGASLPVEEAGSAAAEAAAPAHRPGHDSAQADSRSEADV